MEVREFYGIGNKKEEFVAEVIIKDAQYEILDKMVKRVLECLEKKNFMGSTFESLGDFVTTFEDELDDLLNYYILKEFGETKELWELAKNEHYDVFNFDGYDFGNKIINWLEALITVKYSKI